MCPWGESQTNHGNSGKETQRDTVRVSLVLFVLASYTSAFDVFIAEQMLLLVYGSAEAQRVAC